MPAGWRFDCQRQSFETFFAALIFFFGVLKTREIVLEVLGAIFNGCESEI